MSTRSPYPVRVEARLDEPLSRWLWLVKWILAIPHYVVLFFLTIAFFVMTVVAFFAILFTGSYPRSIFDFNAGVLRWWWRVSYYSYGTLGTDRYPPFTLADDPEYPARLEIAYPERLSRGLVLVKWWLLAIPHYLIVGILAGGGWFVWHGRSWQYGGGGGLIELLVLVSAIALAFGGSYPRSLYDLIVGLNRWVLRVGGYASLMTDEYPPFRLDMGGSEEAGSVPPPPPGSAPSATTARRSGWTAGRVVAVISGALMALVSVGLLGAGGVALWADRTQRDDAGFVSTPAQDLDTGTYAITVEDVDLRGDGPTWAFPSAVLGDARVRAQSVAPDGTVFVGIARSRDVERYLGGAAHATVRDLFDNRLAPHAGGSPGGAPADESFWAESASGSGRQGFEWDVASGNWSVVIMNADASKGVHVVGDVGVTAPALPWIAVVLLAIGAVLLVVGIVLIAGASRRVSAPATTS